MDGGGKRKREAEGFYAKLNACSSADLIPPQKSRRSKVQHEDSFEADYLADSRRKISPCILSATYGDAKKLKCSAIFSC